MMLDLLPDSHASSRGAPQRGTNLRDVVYVLFRRKWIILAVSIPIILVGGLTLFRQAGSYTAAARVVVDLTKVDLPKWNPGGRNPDYDRELSTLFNIAMSLPVAEDAAVTLVDSIPIIRELDPNLAGMQSKTDLQEFLVGGLDVSVVGESSILEFRFSSADPRISLMCVGALRDAFVEYQIHERKNPHAVAYYKEQSDIVQAQIDSLLGLRGEILGENGYSSLSDELRYQSGQLADSESQLYKAQVNRMSLEAQYEVLSSYLDGDPRDFPMGQEESRSHTLVYWRNMVSKYEDQLNSTLTVHTEESIPARRRREMLDEALERLRKEEHAYVQSLAVQLESIRGRERSLQEQIAELRGKNSKGPEVYQRVSLVDVQIESLRGLLDDLQGKLGEVRLSEMADERVSPVAALTDPELTMIISGGKTVVYFVMIVFLSIALGIVIAFVFDSMDHRIYGPDDVETSLKLPVFASISKAD